MSRTLLCSVSVASSKHSGDSPESSHVGGAVCCRVRPPGVHLPHGVHSCPPGRCGSRVRFLAVMSKGVMEVITEGTLWTLAFLSPGNSASMEIPGCRY